MSTPNGGSSGAKSTQIGPHADDEGQGGGRGERAGLQCVELDSVGESPRQAGDAGCARYPADERRQRGADPRPDLGQGGRHHSCADSKSAEKGFAYRVKVVIQ